MSCPKGGKGESDFIGLPIACEGSVINKTVFPYWNVQLVLQCIADYISTSHSTLYQLIDLACDSLYKYVCSMGGYADAITIESDQCWPVHIRSN